MMQPLSYALRRPPPTLVTSPPLVAHVIHRLGVGGLENGVVNLINTLPREQFQHAIICLTEATDFRTRLACPELTQIIELHKRAGQDPAVHRRLWRALRTLRPAIVHTRNIATLEAQVTALLAGSAVRIHSEHGCDIAELLGKAPRNLLLRKCLRSLPERYIAVSDQLRDWLTDSVGVPQSRVVRIKNGVDASLFSPSTRFDSGRAPLPLEWRSKEIVVVGSVGRMQAVKDPMTLVRAFVGLVTKHDWARRRLRLLMVGAGPLRQECEHLMETADVRSLAFFTGERADVAELMRSMDLFVLPSLGEGMSNTVLEAMACGLPVIATHVGGNSELVRDGQTGMLVPAADDERMALAIARYASQDELRLQHGANARACVVGCYDMDSMGAAYAAVYRTALARKGAIALQGPQVHGRP